MIVSWPRSIKSWFRSIRGEQSPRRLVSRPFRGYRLEELESRWNPAGPPGSFTTFTVDTLQDIVNPSDGLTSLREAFQSAQSNSGDSNIVFANPLFVAGPRTLTLTEPLVFPIASGTVSLLGPGADKLTISGNDQFQIFQNSTSLAVIQGVTLAKGSSTTSGGAITNSGTMTILDCVIRDSNVTGPTGLRVGGGVANFGTLLVQNTAFINNKADQGGGLGNSGMVTVVNSTFANNRANTDGGAIYNTSGAILRQVTIAHNLANAGMGPGQGGGIFNLSSPNGPFSLTLVNSILANNQVVFSGGSLMASDFQGTPLDAASVNDIIAHAGSAGGLTDGVNGNQIGVNPKLMGLQVGPGGTFFFSLFDDSPAIDAGDFSQSLDIDGNPLPVDQLGLPRVVGTTVDVGAYEYAPPPSAIVPSIPGIDFMEGSGVVAIDPLLQLIIPPSNQPVGAAKIIPVNFAAEDFLTILPNGVVEVAGSTVTVSGRVVASFTIGVNEPLTFLFVSDATVAEIERVLRAVAFGNLSNRPSLGPRLVAFKIYDSSPAGEVNALYSVSVRPFNDVPRVGPIADLRIFTGQLAIFQVEASDLDSDVLQFSLASGGELGATIDVTTGVFKWPALVPPGIYRFTVKVTDDGSPPDTESVSFLIEVLPLGVGDGEVGLPLPFPGGGPFGPLIPGEGPPPPRMPMGGPPGAGPGLFLGTSPFSRPALQQPPSNGSNPNPRDVRDRGEGPGGESARRGPDEQGPGNREGRGGREGPGGPGNDRIRPDGPQARLPFSPQGPGERRFQPPPEVRSERQSIQVLSRTMIRTESLSESPRPIATPSAAISSVLDSDDTVALIDELRRDLAPITVSTPSAAPTSITLRQLNLIDEELSETEVESPQESGIEDEEEIPSDEPTSSEGVPEEETLRRGTGILVPPFIAALLWTGWQRWRRFRRRR